MERMIKMTNKTNITDEHSFIKKYFIGVIVGIIFFVFLSWIYSGFSFNFFRSWQIIAVVAIGFAFSLGVVPAILIGLQGYKNNGKITLKKRLLTGIIFCLVFIAFDLIADYFLGYQIDWYFYLADVIVFLIISII